MYKYDAGCASIVAASHFYGRVDFHLTNTTASAQSRFTFAREGNNIPVPQVYEQTPQRFYAKYGNDTRTLLLAYTSGEVSFSIKAQY